MQAPGKRRRRYILVAVILVVLVGAVTAFLGSNSSASMSAKVHFFDLYRRALLIGMDGAAPSPEKPSNLSRRLFPDGPYQIFMGGYEIPCEMDKTCEVTRPISPDPHNIDGAWRNFVARMAARPNIGAREDGLPPYTPEAEKMVYHGVEMEAKGTPVAASEMYCRPEGTAKDIALMHVIDVLQTPDRIYMVYDDRHEVRTVFLDRPHPPNLEPTYMGHSIGHWEGDTLVVDTIGFNDKTWLDFSQSPHGTQLHMIERYRKIDGGKALENTVTFEDPEFYTHPFTLRIVYEWRPQTYATERLCEPYVRALMVDGVEVQ